jgi:LysM repeat protein
MANQDLINAFDDCVDRLATGQSIEECLRLYPQYEALFRPLLETGQVVRRLQLNPLEVTQAQAVGRSRLDAALREPYIVPRQRTYPILRLAAVLLIGFLVFTGGAAAYSQSSLPGDALYGLKLFTENAQLNFSADADALQESFAARRLAEIQSLFAAGRSEKVTFEGVVTEQNADRWVIANLPIQIGTELPGLEGIRLGDTVRVEGLTTTQGTILASRIERIMEGEIPLPTATASPSATTLPTQTSTPSASPTLSATVPATNTSAPSATPQPTLTSPPQLTAAPTNTPLPTASATNTVCVPSAPAGWVSYRVRSGDTLSALAVRGGIPVEDLLRVNCLNAANFLVVGQELFVPERAITNPPPENSNGSGSDNGSGNANDNTSGGGDQNNTDNSNDNDDNDDDSNDNDDNSGSGSGNSGSGGGGDDD